MSQRRRPYVGPSEAQSQALAMRETPYTEAHRNSYLVKMQRTDPPAGLPELTNVLRRAYADEVPTRIHVHQTDAGGDPAWSPEFTNYLTASDHATDRRDTGTTEVYTTPFRSALTGMGKSPDETTRKRAQIVVDCVIGDMSPVEATILVGVPPWCAKTVARDALTVFWRRLSDIRLDLGSKAMA